MDPGVEKIRLRFEPPQTREYGGFFGYSNLVKAVESMIENDPSSPIGLRINSPQAYRAIKGVKVNLALTMWESRDFPKSHVANVRQADALIVPTTFCKGIFEKICDVPVYVVPIGVSDDFTYERRRKPTDRPFRWLWVNAPDMRKGFHLLGRIWEKNFYQFQDMELYFKTTGNTDAKVERIGNVIFDSRVLPKRELVELYHSAHGYVYPTMGEGFGLTIAEAMATGLPCVGTGFSGHMDFLNHGTGFPTAYKMQRISVTRDDYLSDAEDGKFEVAMPDPTSVANNMIAVMKKYPRATEKAWRGARLIREKFSMWAMYSALKKVVDAYR